MLAQPTIDWSGGNQPQAAMILLPTSDIDVDPGVDVTHMIPMPQLSALVAAGAVGYPTG